MANDDNWDISQYRSAHETDEQWDLKRKFMEMHRGSLPEERVVCLAQVLANVEFLGCRYPPETMSSLAELSRGLVEDYREKQRGKLQRTFVKASDAAGARFKQGRKMPMETSHPIPVKLMKKNEPSEGITLVNEQDSASCTQAVKKKKKKKKKAVALAPQQPEQIVESEETDVKNEVSSKTSKKKKKKKVKLGDDVINVQDASVAETKSIPAFQGSKTTYHLPTFVLVGREHTNGTELSGWNMLQRSCSLNQCPLEYLCDPSEDANSKTVRIVISGQTIVTSSASNVKLAKQDVAQKAVEQLRQTQLCIIEKQVSDGSDPLKTEDILQSEHTSDNLPESNVGAKLMRLMGWSGGGVGKKAGRTDIVSTQALFGRSGLGYSGQVDQEDLRKKAQHYMAKYVNSNQEHDLIFSSDLTNEERKAIHLGVRRFSGQLKSQSYGAGQDRYLMVSRKLPKSQLVDMARHLWEQQLRTGQANPKFRVIAPSHFQPSPTY